MRVLVAVSSQYDGDKKQFAAGIRWLTWSRCVVATRYVLHGIVPESLLDEVLEMRGDALEFDPTTDA